MSRVRSEYTIEDVSSLSCKSLLARHEAETSSVGVRSMLVLICMMTELRLCTFVTCGGQYHANIIAQSVL